MASIERRQHKSNPPYWRVAWYQDGKKQHERFETLSKAVEFRDMVKEAHNRWPPRWIPGEGFPAPAETTAETFADYAEKTIAHRLRADEQTRRSYVGMLRNHLNPTLAKLHLHEVDRFAVARVAQTMATAGRSPKTIANVHGLLSSILADAVADGLIPRNPARGALPTLPGVKSEEAVSLTVAEFAQVADQLPEGTYRDLARFLVGTGLRWSEATALQVGAVDLLGKRVLYVQRAWKRRGGTFELGEPKTRRSRRKVDLSPELVDLLAGHVAAKTRTEFVFTTPHGHTIRHANYYGRVWIPAVERARRCKEHAKAVEPCGCPGTLTKRPGLHSLRHTHGSWLMDAGVSIVEIQRRMGHESIQTTIDRYGHPSGATSQINDAIDSRLRLVPSAGRATLNVVSPGDRTAR